MRTTGTHWDWEWVAAGDTSAHGGASRRRGSPAGRGHRRGRLAPGAGRRRRRPPHCCRRCHRATTAPPAPAPGAVRTRDAYTPGVDQGRGGPYRQDRVVQAPRGRSRRRRQPASCSRDAGGPGQNRTATAEGEGFTVPAPASAGVRRVGIHARTGQLFWFDVRRCSPRLLPALLPGEAARGGTSWIGSLELMGSVSMRRGTARQMSSATCESAQRSRLDVDVGGASGIAPP